MKDAQKELFKHIQQLGYRHSTWEAFSDFCEVSAIAISNSVDWRQREEREKRYLETIARYEPKEQARFPEMFALLVQALENELTVKGPDCNQLVVTAVDVDLKCVHMAYLQFSLYGIPAVVIHGNTLSVEEWSRWYTPIYIVNGWTRKQACGITEASFIPEAPKELQQLTIF